MARTGATPGAQRGGSAAPGGAEDGRAITLGRARRTRYPVGWVRREACGSLGSHHGHASRNLDGALQIIHA